MKPICPWLNVIVVADDMCQICRPTFPLRIAFETPALPAPEAQHLLRTTQHALDDLNDFSSHHLRLVFGDDVRNKSQSQEDIAMTVKLVSGGSGPTPRADLHTYAPVMDVYYTQNQIPSSSSTGSPLASFIANELQKTFNEEQAVLAYSMAATSWQPSQWKSMSQELADALGKRKTRSFKYAPTYHLTFSLFSPTATPSNWDIETALGDYLAPLLDSLSAVSNFTVDTQVQLYATLSPSIVGPQYDESRKVWTLMKEDLSGFINAAEWPLSPSIGDGPTINFILYVPPADQSPLILNENGGSSWLIPQWGGIQILNLPQARTSLSRADLEPAMQTFSDQLLSLLGLPTEPRSFPLRISTLTRVHAASLMYSASSTLGAIARLTQSLKSIAIPDAVARDVQQTMAHLDEA
jgi:phosphatidylinositol glycan class S